jgi:hypothetical protein
MLLPKNQVTSYGKNFENSSTSFRVYRDHVNIQKYTSHDQYIGMDKKYKAVIF